MILYRLMMEDLWLGGMMYRDSYALSKHSTATHNNINNLISMALVFSVSQPRSPYFKVGGKMPNSN